jgi:hypothetical protein
VFPLSSILPLGQDGSVSFAVVRSQNQCWTQMFMESDMEGSISSKRYLRVSFGDDKIPPFRPTNLPLFVQHRVLPSPAFHLLFCTVQHWFPFLPWQCISITKIFPLLVSCRWHIFQPLNIIYSHNCSIAHVYVTSPHSFM